MMHASRFMFDKANIGDLEVLEGLLFSNLESRTDDFLEGFVQNPYSVDLISKTYVIRDGFNGNHAVAMCVVDDFDESTSRFYKLPTYDKNGKVIHYTCVSKEVRKMGLASLLYGGVAFLNLQQTVYAEIQHSPHLNMASIVFHTKFGFKPISLGEYKSQVFVLYEFTPESECQFTT